MAGRSSLAPVQMEIRSIAADPADIAAIRSLFLESAHSLDFDLCFQSFDEEVASLPGMYSQPEGRLLLATIDGQPAGCVALHPLESDICEMKRLYVKPTSRGHKLGLALVQR